MQLSEYCYVMLLKSLKTCLQLEIHFNPHVIHTPPSLGQSVGLVTIFPTAVAAPRLLKTLTKTSILLRLCSFKVKW